MAFVIGINGSPRKDWNSAQILESALKGAQAAGAQTKLVHLRDLQFTGCLSCFSCKLKDETKIGHCALQDDLTPILEEILKADALFISMPIYCGDVPGMVRNLFERIWFPGSLYSKDGAIAYTHKEKVRLFYTMNVADENTYKDMIDMHISRFAHDLGDASALCINDTLQFSDYNLYHSTAFDEAQKRAHHEAQFPLDLEKAFQIGQNALEK